MKRNAFLFSLLALSLLVLAACSTGGGPDLPQRTQLSPAGDTTAAYSGDLILGQTDFFALDGADVTGDLIVVELNANLRLELTTLTGATVLGVSNGPEFFGATEVTTSGVEPAAIGVTPVACRGSCIVLPAADDTYYFQVSGATLPTQYDVFVYGSDYLDLGEPGNDSQAGAATYFLGEEDEGAIETMGDVDWWLVAGLDPLGEPMEFVATGELDLELYVVTLAGESEPYPSGTVVALQPGDLLRVESAEDRAARGTASLYYFSPVTPVSSGSSE
ncbi:MAG: hypothetical protein WDA03_03040 [Trueperaceae bacterium]